VLLRSDHNTHSLTTGDRYVKLAFRVKQDDEDEDEEEGAGRRGRRGRDREVRGRDRELRVTAPRLQGQAVPGVYMLFVVDERGVPSVGHRVDLKP
jgi:galactose oxidase-like protein